jgi:hypothetical protein
MLDYKSLSNDQLYEVLKAATAELRSRADVSSPPQAQNVCTIIMRRTKRGEPRAVRFTNVNGIVVQFPLTFDQIVGKSGNVLRGDFPLEQGDVVWKIAANGISEFVIAWPGIFEDHDPDFGPVFRGRSDAETVEKIEAFVRGDRSLIVNRLSRISGFGKKPCLSMWSKQRRASIGREQPMRLNHAWTALRRCFAGPSKQVTNRLTRTAALVSPRQVPGTVLISAVRKPLPTRTKPLARRTPEA